MQTPAGLHLTADGRFLPEDWWAIIFNPVLPLSPGAHGDRRVISPRPWSSGRSARGTCCSNRSNQPARIMFSMAMWMAVVVAPLQIVVGDSTD